MQPRTRSLPLQRKKKKKNIHSTLSDTHSIRILVLKPGKVDDPIHYSFETISLGQSHTEYGATSYPWEIDKPCKETHFPDGGFKVREYLYSALLRFPNSTTPRRLWADEIRIYSHRTAMKHLGIIKFVPQVFEGFNVTHLTSQSGYTFSRVF
jgi:hypothetical protein